MTADTEHLDALSVYRSRLCVGLLRGSVLAIASLASYLLVTNALGSVGSVAKPDDALGGMWAVISTIFVFRIGHGEDMAAALSRTSATTLSFVLCLAYLFVLPFSPLGLAVLIGVGTLILSLVGRETDIITTAITTAVVMVVAGLAPTNAWEVPILRAVDTAVGIAVGLAAVWFLHAVGDRPHN
jgi:hypothetical protein